MPTGYIYKIWSLQSDEIYIGSTQCVRTRKNLHKTDCNNANSRNHHTRIYQHIRENGGWDAWFMNVIEQVEYNHRWELETREAHHIKTLNASLNCRIPTRTNTEYRQDNRERIAAQKKQYYQDNRERIAEKSKQYRQDNKEALAEKGKQYRRDNRERLNERDRQYRRDNPDHYKQYHRANRERIIAHKKEKITCECGTLSNRSSIRRHQKSKKHHDLFYKKTYDFIWS